jgi:hypothetical protein
VRELSAESVQRKIRVQEQAERELVTDTEAEFTQEEVQSICFTLFFERVVFCF